MVLVVNFSPTERKLSELELQSKSFFNLNAIISIENKFIMAIIQTGAIAKASSAVQLTYVSVAFENVPVALD